MSIFSTERRAVVSVHDGTELTLRQWGPEYAPVTVVLLHGHCLSTQSWAFVQRQLETAYPNAKIVAYDHRGHGESATAATATYTISQLARDLHAVLDIVAPIGPVVLVGHSMGGMTAITYAGLYPHEIGNRIAGVALIATAASGLAEAGYGRLLRNPAVSWFQSAVRIAPAAMRRAKKVACTVFAPVVRSAEFGNRKVSPRILALAATMHNATPIETMAGFLSSFMTYDETAALRNLSAVPTLVLCGSADLMTPQSHSVAMAAEVEYADLVIVDGAGHSVILEQPGDVATAIGRVLDRVDTPAKTSALVLVA